MEYNCSIYNIVIKEDDEFVYLYNSYSGSLCKLERRIYELINDSMLDDSDKCEHFDLLSQQGFIKPYAVNEYNRILLTEKGTILDKNSDSLSFVIAPTLSCNLNCEYCFEKGYRGSQIVSNDTLIEIAEYIFNKANSECKKINIGWFGGEPLLAFDQIVKFSDYIMPKLHEKNIEYTSSMISNGTLLSPERIRILAEKCLLKKIQITIDGTKKVYCTRKHATENQFDSLFENIKIALDFLKVTIRLNSDGENYEDLKKVTEELIEQCGANTNLNIYIAKLVDYDGCGGEQFLSQNAFDRKRVDFESFLCEKKIVQKQPLPQYRKTFCGLIKCKNEVIGPYGEIYKCEHHIGQRDKVIGNIKYGLDYNDFMMDFIDNKPQNICKACKIFPICLGGCPAQRMELNDKDLCFYSEYYIRSLVLKYI